MENEKYIMDREDVKEELSARRKLKKLKQTLIAVGVVSGVILLLLAVIGIQNAKIDRLNTQIEELTKNPIVVSPVNPVITIDIINAELKEIGELATMEYMYTNAAKFSDAKKIKNWNIPFTEKNFILKWDGVIKAGIDVNAITTDLNSKTNVLIVHIPKAKILSHDPDHESMEVLDEKDGLFNPVKLENQIQFDIAVEKELEERAIENGLLDKAQENAETVITNLLNSIPDFSENYSIVFDVID